MNATRLELDNQRRARSVALGGRWLALIALGAGALLLRVFQLDAQSLWLDEGSTWEMIGQGWGALLADLVNPFAAYPLYHLLLKGWTALAGDSEWALRLPSALAGAAAVAALFGAARELRPLPAPGLGAAALFPAAAALLLAVSPFAVWYAQEAKVYSMLLLAATLLLWSLLRALRLGARRAWLLCAGVALTSVFLHRLALLLLVAAFAAWLLTAGRAAVRAGRGGRWAALFAALLAVGIVAAMARGLGSDRAATGAYIPAGPATALWLTFGRFSVDRWPGDAPGWWLLPWAALTLWGLAALLRELRADRTGYAAPALLCMLVAPTALFLLQLLFTRLYEARYLIIVYPAWLLLLAYPLRRANRAGRLVLAGLLLCALATSAASFVQPKLGLFSGDPVKEQYRTVVGELARRVHPDDLVVLHPAYMRPLYDYYMRRLSADPPPEPVAFGAFRQNQEQFGQREWDTQRRESFSGRLRSFLLIAPEHARTGDVPQPGDEYGLVGLYFQYSREQRKWPCGIWRASGVHLLCQESPEAYYTGAVPQPATPVGAVFGGNLHLLGFTLKATTPAGPGVYRAGGNLPITLFWDVERPPEADYSVFLHLCRDCSAPPVAADDGPPLAGYLPTSTWLTGKPARDDRAIPLPRDLPPGRYTLLLGLYRPGDPSPSARLSVAGPGALEGDRLRLGVVEIAAPE